jgi:hypothetical protein
MIKKISELKNLMIFIAFIYCCNRNAFDFFSNSIDQSTLQQWVAAKMDPVAVE